MSAKRPQPANATRFAACTTTLYVLLFLLTIAPRVGPALRGFHFSPDAAEHALIARALAGGEGFTLPIQVRYGDPGPVVHEAYAERAPLYPWLLALPTRALGATEPGWPDPRLQLLNVLLAGVAAVLGGALAHTLARRRQLPPRALRVAVALGGLGIGWLPGLGRAAVHLWAEPLGLVLALAALLLALRSDPAPASNQAGALGRSSRTLLAAAVLASLARFARPEAWVLVPLLLGLEAWAGRLRRALAVLGVALAVNAAGVLGTGVLAPQLYLLEVRHYEDLMRPGAVAAAPSLSDVLAGVWRNLFEQAKVALTPKNAFLHVPLALLALRRPEARPLLLAAALLVLSTAGVWSTSDPYRFTIAPLALLAPVAAIELVTRARALSAPRPRLVLAALAGAWLAVLGYTAGRELRREPPRSARPSRLQEGTPTLDDPWAYALLTGRSARLARPPR